MLKDEGRFYPGYSIVIYDMIIKCGNKPKTGRKQTRAGSTPTYSLGGRVDEQSLTFRDLEKSGGLKHWKLLFLSLICVIPRVLINNSNRVTSASRLFFTP